MLLWKTHLLGIHAWCSHLLLFLNSSICSVAITLPSGHPTEWCLSNNFSIADEAMSHDSSSDYDILTNNRFVTKVLTFTVFTLKVMCVDSSVTNPGTYNLCA